MNPRDALWHAMPASATEAEALAGMVQGTRLRLRRRLAWLSFCAERSGHGRDTLASVLDDSDQPEAEAAWQRDTPELAALNEAIAQVDAALARTRLAPLGDVLQLQAADVAVLTLAVAVAAEPMLRLALASVDGVRAPVAPTTAHAARLYGLGLTLDLGPGSAARRWHLVHLEADLDGGAPRLAADPAIVAWLGGHALDDEGLRCQSLHAPAALPGWPVAATVDWIAHSVGPRRVRVVGPPGVGRRGFAAVVGEQLGRPVCLMQPADAGTDVGPARPRAWVLACRRARLLGEVIAWVGTPPESPVPEPDLCLLLSEPGERSEASPRPHPTSTAIECRVELPLPDIATRRALWQRHLPAAATWTDAELDRLAIAHRVHVGELRHAARHGVTTPREAADVVRQTGRGALAGLAQRLECPFTLDDLVVSSPVRTGLDDFIFEARERMMVWEDEALRRLFPQGTGLLAMFCGPSGTGKTMCAQVIAGMLGLDLYRIDLAAIVSKYIGETTRNIDQVLATAARMDVVLFFDEADALFGRRTEIRDAHDRYANTDTNYLLQAVESYPGVALLATNRKGNIDQAFLRRLRHVFDFPAPDAGLRHTLWSQLLGGMAGSAARSALEPALPVLAGTLELSGAQIKDAVLHALFAARRDGVAMRLSHVLGGVDRVLLKEGRGLARGERERLLRHEGAP